MGKTKQIWDVHRDVSDDFTVIKDSLLLCKFCDSIVNWKKKTRVQEHMNTKMHQDRKESKLMLWMAAADEAENDDDDVDDDEVETDHHQRRFHSHHHREPPDGDQYSLRWNNHQSNLLRVFSRLFDAEHLTDVLLAAEGRTLRAHKVVLSASSSYFENIFTEFDEKNQVVILKDTSYDDIAAIVEFMYKGEISVAQNQLTSLLKTAESLKVKGLAEVSSSDNSSEPKPPKNPSTSTSATTPTLGHPVAAAATVPAPHYVTTNPAPFEEQVIQQTKRKRGRPRLLDSSGSRIQDTSGPRILDSSVPRVIDPPLPEMDPFFAQSSDAVSTKTSQSSSHKVDATSSSTSTNHAAENADYQWLSDAPMFAAVGDEPTPGGPLTEERIKTLGIVKMNDYIKSGTRQQFWEEYYVRVIMQAVRNKEIDMKGGAELLGVSYGTLYGRYRELFGYVKHAWNVGGRPPKLPSYPPAAFLTDPNNHQIFEQLKEGKINIKQAATLMGIDASTLAYQISGRTSDDCPSPNKLARIDGGDEDDADGSNDYDTSGNVEEFADQKVLKDEPASATGMDSYDERG